MDWSKIHWTLSYDWSEFKVAEVDGQEKGVLVIITMNELISEERTPMEFSDALLLKLRLRGNITHKWE